MFDILENKAPKNAERISEERKQKIKASVLSQIVQDKPDKEEKPMKKRTTFKALLVAAAVMTTGAISVIGASAEINRANPEPIAPPAQVDDAVPAASKPAETPKAPEITDIFTGSEKPDIVAISEKYTNSDAVPGLTSVETSGISNLNETKTEINGCKVTVTKYEADGKPYKMIRQNVFDMELIDIEEDGTHVYKTWSGGTFKAWSADGNYDGDYMGCGSFYLDF